MTQKAPPKKIERRIAAMGYLAENAQNNPEQNRYTKAAAVKQAEIAEATATIREPEETAAPPSPMAASDPSPQKLENEQPKPQTKGLTVTAKPKKETRSEAIIVRVTPSLKAKATKAAKAARVPLTEAINQLLEKWVNN